MSLWYSPKGKGYASRGNNSWLRCYTEHLVSELENALRQLINKHAEGTELLHNANNIRFDKGRYVGSVLEETEQRSLELDEAMTQERAVRLQTDTALQSGLQKEVELREAETTDLRERVEKLESDTTLLSESVSTQETLLEEMKTEVDLKLEEKSMEILHEKQFLHMVIDEEILNRTNEELKIRNSIFDLAKRVAALESDGGAEE